MGMTRRSRRKTGRRWIRYLVTVLAALLAAFFGFFFVSGYVQEGAAPTAPAAQVALATKGGNSTPAVGSETPAWETIPAYSGRPYAVLEGNRPRFSKALLSRKNAFYQFTPRDALGRCGTAVGRLGPELLPKGKRQPIGMVKPSGWQLSKYSFVDGKYLYNRCHLIAFQLCGENANRLNLITGTRYFNVIGMLPFENRVADYIRNTRHHVLYQVTPVYRGQDLVARGVVMEAWSVEDEGKGVHFHVFVYNVQPGVVINYADGTNHAA
jgi:DNA-entry nuclease